MSMKNGFLFSKVFPKFAKFAKFVVALFFLLSVVLGANTAYASSVDRLDLFLVEVFSRNPIAAKWKVDIRYNTVGLDDSEIVVFDRACSDIEKRINVTISREVEDVNVLFIYSTNMNIDLRKQSVFKLFKKENESYNEYVSRVTSGNDHGFSFANVQKDSILNFFSIIDKDSIGDNKYAAYVKIVIKMLFASLQESNRFNDSILNTDNNAYKALSDFDSIFLEKYYSDAVEHGMNKDEAINVLAIEIRKELEG